MHTPPISAATVRPVPGELGTKETPPQDLEKASQQFESILVRQFLTESMGPLLKGGATGEVFGYLLTDSLANSISQGGGLGVSSVIQAQLGGKKL
jgi:peptidoglycan hydrolase FlgJ